MKHTIITAGTTEVKLKLPKEFQDFWAGCGVEPQAALQQLINYLSVYGFYCADTNDLESAAATIFDFLVKSNNDLPDEPYIEKRSVSARYLLRLNDAKFFDDDPATRAHECRKLIEEWYQELQKLKI